MNEPLKKSSLRDTLESLLITVILAIFGTTFVLQTFKIPTGSMEPNLLVGDHLIVNKMRFAPITRGDVIVFKFPKDPERDFVKRVIGLPGDVVSERAGYVYVDDRRLAEPYVRAADRDTQTQTWPRLGPRQYFVMGDNRAGSCDSRTWGPVPRSAFIGPVVATYWPPNRWTSH